MVSDSLSIKTDSIVEVIHDLAVTDERGTLNSSLELISRIKEKCVSWILIFDNVDK